MASSEAMDPISPPSGHVEAPKNGRRGLQPTYMAIHVEDIVCDM